MAVTLVGSGTAAEASGTASPALPAGIAVGDHLFCLVSNSTGISSSFSGTPTMHPAWKQIYSLLSTDGITAWLNGGLYYCKYTGTSPDLTVTGNGTVRAVIFAYRNCAEVPFQSSAGTTVATAGTTVTYNDGTPTRRNSMILWTWHLKAATTNGAISGSTPTPVEELDDTGTTISDGFADALQLEPQAVGARTSTAGASCFNIGATTLLLEEDAPSTATVTSLPPNQRYA